MTNQQNDSFVQDQKENTDDKNSTFQSEEVDKKSVEGQLAIVQKRLDDQLAFIDTLKGENKQLREQADASGKIEELLSKLDNASQIENAGQQPNQTNTSPMNIDDLRNQGFVTKEDLERQQLESTYADNFERVSSAMIDTYGQDKYLQVVQAKSQELGMPLEAIDQLARTNPTAAIKLMEADKVSSTAPSTTGSINTQAIDKHNEQQAPNAPKSVMFGATTKDMQNAWRQAGEIVQKQMEQGN